MKKSHLSAVALTVSAVIAASAAFAEGPVLPADAGAVKPPSNIELPKPHVPNAALPAMQDEASKSDSGLGNEPQPTRDDQCQRQLDCGVD